MLAHCNLMSANAFSLQTVLWYVEVLKVGIEPCYQYMPGQEMVLFYHRLVQKMCGKTWQGLVKV
jgi:hypothetical protein